MHAPHTYIFKDFAACSISKGIRHKQNNKIYNNIILYYGCIFSHKRIEEYYSQTDFTLTKKKSF